MCRGCRHDRRLGEEIQDPCGGRVCPRCWALGDCGTVAGDAVEPIGAQSFDFFCEFRGLFGGNEHGVEECREPGCNARRCSRGVWVAEVSVGGEALDVALTQRREHQAHREDRSRRQAASRQNGVDNGSSDAAVPVGERVDGLELSVDQCCLNNRSVERPVEVVDEVTHQGIHVCRLRGNEGCL